MISLSFSSGWTASGEQRRGAGVGDGVSVGAGVDVRVGAGVGEDVSVAGGRFVGSKGVGAGAQEALKAKIHAIKTKSKKRKT